MDEGEAMLWGRVTYEMMESCWPAVARGDEEAPPAMREWAVKLEAKPKYVVSSTRQDFPWSNSHHVAGDLRTGGVLLQRRPLAGRVLCPRWRGCAAVHDGRGLRGRLGVRAPVQVGRETRPVQRVR
jgi:hypothetical protein